MNIIADADDFCEDTNALDLLFRIKARLPKFRITMFAIPARGTIAFWREVRKLDWIRLAMHGFHHTHLENEKWTRFEADALMRTVMGWTDTDGAALFSPVYKSPQWRANQATVDAASAAGLIIAANPDPASNPHGTVAPAGTKQYYFAGNMITDDHRAADWVREHMHIGPKDCTNELSYVWHHMIEKFSPEDDWFFVDDVVNSLYAKN